MPPPDEAAQLGHFGARRSTRIADETDGIDGCKCSDLFFVWNSYWPLLSATGSATPGLP
jgi:hypothetical protein